MAEPDLAGASLPEGIEVDETAAYFGITDSSDIVHQLMSMGRNQSITAFFSICLLYTSPSPRDDT